MTLLKKLRKVVEMAKNQPKRGKSARNGNAPSPYQKKGKIPYQYSTAYYTWRRDRLAGRATPVKDQWRADDRDVIRHYKIAAE